MVGLMFYAPKDQDIVDVIRWGVRYYQKRYGKDPEVCIVNPIALIEQTPPDLQVVIKAEKYVFPHNIWIGHEQDKPEEDQDYSWSAT